MIDATTKMDSLLEPETAGMHGRRFQLPAELHGEIRRLSRLRPWRSSLAIAANWGAIGIAGGLALSWPQPWTWLLAALVIASRQHALGILMHEAVHYRLLASHFWNDRLSNWLLAYPILTTTEGYRRHHLDHHRYLNTHRDPDWLRKQTSEWTFPKARLALIVLFIRNLFGGGFVEMVQLLRHFREGASRSDARRSGCFSERLIFHLLLAGAVALTGTWMELLILWILPLLTLMQPLMRLRSLAEHWGLETEHDLNKSRNTRCWWWERLLLVPHNVHFHLDHHLHPSVPYYNLPGLHQLLCQVPAYATVSHQNESLLGPGPRSVWDDLTTPRLSGPEFQALPFLGVA